MAFPDSNWVAPWTIASGASLSGAINLAGYHQLAIEVPAGFTGTTITFQAADDLAGTYSNVYDDSGAEVSVTVAAGHIVSLSGVKDKIGPLQFIKIRSGTSAAPVNQSAAVTGAIIEKW